MKDKKDNNQLNTLPIGMCLGLSIGTAIGAATNNIGLWMSVGLLIGMCLDIVIGYFNKNTDGKDNNNENKEDDGNDDMK